MRDLIFGSPPENLVLVEWPTLWVRSIGVILLAVLALISLLEVF